jgi:hypothetical protein
MPVLRARLPTAVHGGIVSGGCLSGEAWNADDTAKLPRPVFHARKSQLHRSRRMANHHDRFRSDATRRAGGREEAALSECAAASTLLAGG